MFRVLIWAMPILALSLSGCGSDSHGASSTGSGTGSGVTVDVKNYAQGQNIAFNGEVLTTFPSEMQSAKDVGFTQYVELTLISDTKSHSSNTEKKIRILATDDNANGEKVIRAVNIISHLLTNKLNSTYGSNKASIAQKLASREATLMLTSTEKENAELLTGLFAANAIKLNVLRNLVDGANVSDPASINTSELKAFTRDFSKLSEPDQEQIIDAFYTQLPLVAGFPKWILNSQGLYYRELTVVGDCHYMSNFDIPSTCQSLGKNGDGDEADRDAAFEEILHLIQAQGIAPNNSTKAYQEQVRAEAFRQYTDKKNGSVVAWNPTENSWKDWEGDDKNPEIGQSYSHEYLASVFEAYMGMWQHKTEGLDGYKLTSREKMKNGNNGINDDAGLEFVTGMFHNMIQNTVRIDSNGVADYHRKKGTDARFVMNTYQVTPPIEAYTYKSQYYLNAKIIGDKAISLFANNEDNILEGNSQPNTINGLGGNDTYVIDNKYDECVIDNHPSMYVFVTCPNTGKDMLFNIEKLAFKDTEVLVSSL
ncbi:hypothetical protein L4C33_20785 [Vibrio makurazakiensis]|uniref:hypothetical protein n=1 Tax=Vibrio makurazakiensis TaxID=2910250 RepID=UPI003D0A45CC